MYENPCTAGCQWENLDRGICSKKCQRHFAFNLNRKWEHLPIPTAKRMGIVVKDGPQGPEIAPDLLKKPTPLACRVSDCARPAATRGFCKNHYAFWHKGLLKGFPCFRKAGSGDNEASPKPEPAGPGAESDPARQDQNSPEGEQEPSGPKQNNLANEQREETMNKTCDHSGCDSPAKARGLCGKHYDMWRTKGLPGRSPFKAIRPRCGRRKPVKKKRSAVMARPRTTTSLPEFLFKVDLTEYPKMRDMIVKTAERFVVPPAHIIISLVGEGLAARAKEVS